MATQKRSTNWFAIWISIVAAVVLVGLGVVVVALNNQTTAPGASPDSEIVNSETGGIGFGEGPDEVAVWFDFYCPHCQDFEDIYGPKIQALLSAGDINLQLHPVALAGLNAASGTDFSERSASAMYCVAETNPEAALPFFQQLFAKKPTGPGLTDDELTSLATEVGAAGASQCIADGTYRDFAVAQAGEIPTNPDSGGAGTPTLLVNAEYVSISGDVDADIIKRLNG